MAQSLTFDCGSSQGTAQRSSGSSGGGSHHSGSDGGGRRRPAAGIGARATGARSHHHPVDSDDPFYKDPASGHSDSVNLRPGAAAAAVVGSNTPARLRNTSLGGRSSDGGSRHGGSSGGGAAPPLGTSARTLYTTASGRQSQQQGGGGSSMNSIRTSVFGAFGSTLRNSKNASSSGNAPPGGGSDVPLGDLLPYRSPFAGTMRDAGDSDHEDVTDREQLPGTVSGEAPPLPRPLPPSRSLQRDGGGGGGGSSMGRSSSRRLAPLAPSRSHRVDVLPSGVLE